MKFIIFCFAMICWATSESGKFNRVFARMPTAKGSIKKALKEEENDSTKKLETGTSGLKTRNFYRPDAQSSALMAATEKARQQAQNIEAAEAAAEKQAFAAHKQIVAHQKIEATQMALAEQSQQQKTQHQATQLIAQGKQIAALQASLTASNQMIESLKRAAASETEHQIQKKKEDAAEQLEEKALVAKAKEESAQMKKKTAQAFIEEREERFKKIRKEKTKGIA
jgi:uncharacterized phage infection (PIP) family protein YhgE